jgi:hypothetical protein
MLPLINFEVKFEIDRLIKTVALTCAQPDCDRSFELQHGSRGSLRGERPSGTRVVTAKPK